MEENEQVIPAAGDALLADALRRFGELVDRSQQLPARRIASSRAPHLPWVTGSKPVEMPGQVADLDLVPLHSPAAVQIALPGD